MRLPVLLIALISTAFAKEEHVQRSARAPQGQIRYDDPDGLKVNWKFFAPQNQWRSHLENSQRSQRAEPDVAQPEQQAQHQHQHQHQQSQLVQAQPQALAQAEPNQQYYKPYSAVPPAIKQLLLQSYEPQKPYVDQSAFLYTSNFAAPQYDQQSATAELSHYEQPAGPYQSQEQKYQTRRDYSDRRLKGRIQYKDDYDQQEQQQEQQEPQVQHVPVPIETMPLPSPPKLVFDKSMPQEIQQLLQYQSQIPYDVIANRITYKPKTLFIPKPLPDDVKGPYYYRSKVYYVKNDEVEPDYETGKPVDEDPRH